MICASVRGKLASDMEDSNQSVCAVVWCRVRGSNESSQARDSGSTNSHPKILLGVPPTRRPPRQTMDSLPMTIMAMGIAMTSPMAMVQPTAKQ